LPPSPLRELWPYWSAGFGRDPGRPSALRRDQLADGDVLGPVRDARCARAARRRASPVLDGASVRRRWAWCRFARGDPIAEHQDRNPLDDL